MNTKSIVRAAIVACPTLLLCNCATIFGGGSPKQVSLTSNPPGAAVTVTNKAGETVFNGTTPTTAALSRKAGYFQSAKYQAEFSKKGYATQTVNIDGSINPMYFGNFIFGGLLGLLIVDPLTGAMWTLDDAYAAEMGLPTSTKHRGSVAVYDKNSIPKEWNAHLVAVR